MKQAGIVQNEIITEQDKGAAAKSLTDVENKPTTAKKDIIDNKLSETDAIKGLSSANDTMNNIVKKLTDFKTKSASQQEGNIKQMKAEGFNGGNEGRARFYGQSSAQTCHFV